MGKISFLVSVELVYLKTHIEKLHITKNRKIKIEREEGWFLLPILNEIIVIRGLWKRDFDCDRCQLKSQEHESDFS